MRRLNPPSTKIQLILARCLLGFPGSVCATSRSSGSDLQSCLSLASLPFDLDSSLSFYPTTSALLGFPGGSEGKASACNVGDSGSIPGSGRSPGGGNGHPLQHSFLENPMDGGAWWTTVHRVTKSQTQLSDFTSLHKCKEKHLRN